MQKKAIIAFSILVFIVLASCSKYQRVLKGTDLEKKYDVAVQYYNSKDYYKALPLFEELTSVYRGTKRAEKVYYYYAFSHYGMGDYVLASYHFNNFVQTFPNSALAEECLFMNAYCYYLDSPESILDQTNTYKAINELQLFVNKYPQSTRVQECNKLLDELRLKLETKALANAKLYYHTENYRSAIVAFENVLKEYPDTRYREELLFLLIRSHYYYALNSIDEKKTERYKMTVDAYNKFIDAFPKSEKLKEAEQLFEHSLKEIEKQKSLTTKPE